MTNEIQDYQIGIIIFTNRLSDYNKTTKRQKEMARLEKLAKKEKQSKKKFEIVQQINELRKGSLQ